MRLFISIQVDKNMRDALDEVRGSLRLAGIRGSYTRTENLHLTLAFIGEHPDPDAVFLPRVLILAGAGQQRHGCQRHYFCLNHFQRSFQVDFLPNIRMPTR